MSVQASEFLNVCQWPGNVRQLENICRFLTVMASGQEILQEDLPNELTQTSSKISDSQSESCWQSALKNWMDEELAQGKSAILDHAYG